MAKRRSAMPDPIVNLLNWLDTLGFEETASVIEETWDGGGSPREALKAAEQDIDWHEEQAADTEDTPVFAAARVLVSETRKLIA